MRKKNQLPIVTDVFSFLDKIKGIDGIAFHAVIVFSTSRTSSNSDVTVVTQNGKFSSAAISGARSGRRGKPRLSEAWQLWAMPSLAATDWRSDRRNVRRQKHFASFVAIDKGCRGALPGQRIR